ncbi:MAG: hypothetical protein ACD_28C00133G0010 [uncultured bacterium]|nr:MAG: hypothetical protein ACD_28C00133G0010 [uncultured bacterium]KKT75282.1 MAG: hypothetical protein UW70_C0036G0006 [Candidatus Peregrinibacteria bacterium GW2011_GWA2_44_7]
MDSSDLYRSGGNLVSDVEEDEFPRIYSDAIYDAEQKYGVVSAPHAPVISWEPDPESTMVFNRKFAWGTVLFMNVVYVIVLIVLEVRKRRNKGNHSMQ